MLRKVCLFAVIVIPFGSVNCFLPSPDGRTLSGRTLSDNSFVLRQAAINEDLTTTRRQRDQPSSLSAASIGELDIELLEASQLIDPPRLLDVPQADWPSQSSADWQSLATVLTTALMVSGNTIGAGCLVLPEVAVKPGLAVATCLFGGESLFQLFGKCQVS